MKDEVLNGGLYLLRLYLHVLLYVPRLLYVATVTIEMHPHLLAMWLHLSRTHGRYACSHCSVDI